MNRFACTLLISAALIGATVIVRRTSNSEPIAVQKVERSAAVSPEPPAPPVIVLPEAPAAPPAPPAPLPAPTPEIRQEPAALRDWLLQLPSSDFQKLVGTKQMDEYVTGVLGGLARPESSLEIANFLKQLNAQILQANSAK